MAWVAAVAEVRSLARELLHATGAAKKKKKRTVAEYENYRYVEQTSGYQSGEGKEQGQDKDVGLGKTNYHV